VASKPSTAIAIRRRYRLPNFIRFTKVRHAWTEIVNGGLALFLESLIRTDRPAKATSTQAPPLIPDALLFRHTRAVSRSDSAIGFFPPSV
jgi:hypothetical protein